MSKELAVALDRMMRGIALHQQQMVALNESARNLKTALARQQKHCHDENDLFLLAQFTSEEREFESAAEAMFDMLVWAHE